MIFTQTFVVILIVAALVLTLAGACALLALLFSDFKNKRIW